jgi:Schlafen, AlbA_2
MSTYGLPLSRIDADFLESLRTDAVAEGRQLDYKEQLHSATDEEAKREFLRDVSSFANAVGGDLIYGVREARDAAGKATGAPESIVGLSGANLDQEKLRLEQSLLNGIAPRIPGVLFHTISRGAEDPCLLVRIPQSPIRLHMVTYGGIWRFYGRGTSGRVQLDVGQIRAGFLEVETARERMKRFRLDRIARIIAGDTPIPMGDGAKLIFHAFPLTSLDVWPAFLEIAKNEAQVPNLLRPMAISANNWRYNLDGFVAHTVRREPSEQTYIQLFRDGGIEVVGGVLSYVEHRRGFFGLAFEQATIPVLRTTQRLWKLLGVTGPIVLGLVLSGAKGWRMVAGSLGMSDPDVTVDTELAILPEVVVQDENAPADQALKPLFDLAWNAGGRSRSPFYDDTGQRQEPR